MSDTIAEGDPIPAFTVESTNGQAVSADDFKGSYSVLYFYPKDSTPGCTQEGQAFRDLHAEFDQLGAKIFGVSRDSLKSHDNFKCKQGFPFELLSDPDESLCRAFDVIRMKNMYGKQVQGIERSTFLFDPEGRVAKAWRKVRVPGHAEEVLGVLKSLKGA